jgi:hypothetical protein
MSEKASWRDLSDIREEFLQVMVNITVGREKNN